MYVILEALLGVEHINAKDISQMIVVKNPQVNHA